MDPRARRAAADEEGRLVQGREGRLQALFRGHRQRRRRRVQRGPARRGQHRRPVPAPLPSLHARERPLARQRARELRHHQVRQRAPGDRADLRLRLDELLPEPAPRRPQGRRRPQPDQDPREHGRVHRRRPQPDLHHGRDHGHGQAARPGGHAGHRVDDRELPRPRRGRQPAPRGPQVLQGALGQVQGLPQEGQARREAPRARPGQGRLVRALRLLPARPALLQPGLLDPARGQGGEEGGRHHAREAREDDERRVHRPGRGEDRRLPEGVRGARPSSRPSSSSRASSPAR